MAITVSLRQRLDHMVNLSGYAQRADASLGRVKDKRGRGCFAPLACSDAQDGDQDQTQCGPERDTLPKCGDELPDKGDHGVRPVR